MLRVGSGFFKANREQQPGTSRWTFTPAIQASVHCTCASLRLPGFARFRSSLEAPDCCSLVNLAATGSRERKRPDTQHTKRHRAGCEGCRRAGETLRAFGGLRVGTGKAGDQPMSTQDATEQDARSREQGEALAFTLFAQACRGHGWPGRRKVSPASHPPRVAREYRPRSHS